MTDIETIRDALKFWQSLWTSDDTFKDALGYLDRLENLISTTCICTEPDNKDWKIETTLPWVYCKAEKGIGDERPYAIGVIRSLNKDLIVGISYAGHDIQYDKGRVNDFCEFVLSKINKIK